jgi:hypothetical protein
MNLPDKLFVQVYNIAGVCTCIEVTRNEGGDMQASDNIHDVDLAYYAGEIHGFSDIIEVLVPVGVREGVK